MQIEFVIVCFFIAKSEIDNVLLVHVPLTYTLGTIMNFCHKKKEK